MTKPEPTKGRETIRLLLKKSCLSPEATRLAVSVHISWPCTEVHTVPSHISRVDGKMSKGTTLVCGVITYWETNLSTVVAPKGILISAKETLTGVLATDILGYWHLGYWCLEYWCLGYYHLGFRAMYWCLSYWSYGFWYLGYWQLPY